MNGLLRFGALGVVYGITTGVVTSFLLQTLAGVLALAVMLGGLAKVF